MTTPAIQVLLFGDGLGVDVCSVDCGVLELEEATLVEPVAMLEEVTLPEVVAMLEEATLSEVVAMLKDVGTADVAPMDDWTATVLDAFTRPLIWNPGDEICCAYGSAESKKVKRNTQKSFAENASEAMFTFQS